MVEGVDFGEYICHQIRQFLYVESSYDRNEYMNLNPLFKVK